MTKLSLAFIGLAILWALSYATEKQGTCPYEVSSLNIFGYDAPNGDCVTVVPRSQLKIVYSHESNESEYEKAKKYCDAELNGGSLVFQLEQMISHLNLSMLSEINIEEPWNAFACKHKPYADCVLKMNSKCVFDKEKENCFLEYIVDSFVPQQLPYGKSCNWEMNRSPCKCLACSLTQWESWLNHTTFYGRKFQTRYRPFDQMPLHSCSSNSALCCGEFRSDENLQKQQIGCLNRGAAIGTADFTCICPRRYTGMFCEREISSDRDIFFTLAPYNSKLLLGLLLICIAVSLLLVFGMLIRCLQITERQKTKHVVIDINCADQLAGGAYGENYYVHDDDDQALSEKRNCITNRNYIKSIPDRGNDISSRSRTLSRIFSRTKRVTSENGKRYLISKDGRQIICCL